MRLSYSKAASFMECPKRFQFSRDGSYVPIFPEIVHRGRFAHLFYEMYTKECVAQNMQQLEMESINHIAMQARDADMRIAARQGDGMLSLDAYQEVFELACLPWAERATVPVNEVMAVERKWALDGNRAQVSFDSDRAQWRGVFDRVDAADGDGVCVTDYKTGWGRHANKLQADIYAWAAAHIWGAETVVVTFEYTISGRQETYVYGEAEIALVDEGQTLVYEVIRDAVGFPPRPGHHCATCPYRNYCDAPILRHTILDKDQALAAIETLGTLEKEVAEIKDGLKAWVAENGPIEHQGLLWDFHRTSPQGFYSAQDFVASCTSQGLDPWPYLSVNNTKSKKLRKVFPGLVTDGPEMVRFGGKRTTEKED